MKKKRQINRRLQILGGNMGSTFRQFWTVLGAFLNIVATGFHLGYPTILLRDLRKPGSDIPLSLEAESWITSAIAITTLPSFIITAPIMQKFGRRSAHFFVVTPSIITCLLLHFAQDVTALVIARLTSGFNTGATIVIAGIIVGEYSSPKYRGVFLNTKTAGATFGVLYVHFIGTFFDWRATALFGLIPSILALMITWTWSESPSWLAYKGRYKECEKAFTRLRGNSDQAKEELLLLIQTQKNRRLYEVKDSSLMKKARLVLTKLGQKDFQKPTWIVLFVFVIIEACGRHSFPAYAVKFMSAFTTDNTTILYYVLAVDGIIFLSSMSSCGFVKLCRRRTLLFVSGGISCALLTSICVYLYLKSQQMTPEKNVWLPLSLLCLYFIVLNLGTSSIALSLLGEIYPLEHRGLGTAVSGVLYSLSLLIALKVTPALMRGIEVYGTFFVYMLCMAGALTYLYFNLPETEGKTLQEIEHHFNGVPLKLERDNDDKLLDCDPEAR